jgi:hypothetical protein
MKLTTKIVTGIIISIFLLSIGVIIGISFIDIEKYRQSYTGVSLPRISQENIITVEVEPYQTIMVDKELMNDKRDFNPFGTILIKPINEGEKNKLFLPEELLRFTDITSSNDTLIIRLKMDELYEQHYPNKETKSGILYALDGANFFIHSNTVDVICNMYGIELDIRNMETDRIKINTYDDVTIDSCHTNLIKPTMSKGGRFLLKNSQVKELNIDLDQIGYGWQIENCDIEVENLTGSGKHRTDLAMSEAKSMNWLPKSKDAQLTVTLHGDTAKVIFQ